MNPQFIDTLLYRGESELLDFKAEPYPFARASDSAKAEILKDVLGFANAWRNDTAYILIGVKETSQAGREIIGVQDDPGFADHQLQQFINSKTNRPIQFNYQVFPYGDRRLGLITIPVQRRPIWLTKDYGPLRARDVYVRRGSKTDPSRPADPQEIIEMGRDTANEESHVEVAFAAPGSPESLGETLRLQAEYCHVPKRSQIPDYPIRQAAEWDGIAPLGSISRFNNRHYLRERARFEYCHRLYRPFRLMLRNTSAPPARDVRLEFSLPKEEWTLRTELPEAPGRGYDHLIGPIIAQQQFPAPEGRRTPHPGDIEIDELENSYHMAIIAGDIQPGRAVWTESVYIGTYQGGEHRLEGSVYASNLSEPQNVQLIVDVELRTTQLTVEDLANL